jgi:hypothetical protein
MILRKSTKSVYPPRWRSRAEQLRSYLDSLSPDELRKVRPAYYWLRYGQKAWNRECARKANFNPDQPRDDFGRWADSGSGRQATRASESLDENLSESFVAARRRGRSIAFCMAQYAIDGLMCNSVEPVSRRATCWRQSAERLGNCLAGREIPPLNF